MSFAKNLKAERERLNLTADKLAKACGVSRSYITLIENGKRLPGKKVLLRIAKAIGLQPSVIVNWYLESLREKIPLQILED